MLFTVSLIYFRVNQITNTYYIRTTTVHLIHYLITPDTIPDPTVHFKKVFIHQLIYLNRVGR